MNYDTEHIPAPAGHAPRLESYQSNGVHGVFVENPRREGAWMHCENPIEVER